MSAPPERETDAERFEKLRNALKETVLNLEGVVEEAERTLRRARERLEALTEYDDEC